ncbi:MAG: D-aminoacyl-tRNA deacylase [Crocinitomicaceae bacterium]|nr:D-aminoacyl-tRNA deacylase [Crocinitomicaceae bacterium]
MRVLIQRVQSASVSINQNIVGQINNGLLLFIAFEELDDESDLHWAIKKVLGLRIFSDHQQKMNLSIEDITGEILVVSQFTLFASTKKGNRPSFIRSANPDYALNLYERFNEILQIQTNLNIQNGEFGADMKVSLLNDGPVTIAIDSKNRE